MPSSEELDLPPPRRILLVFFSAAGEEQVPEHGDDRGSVVELVPPLSSDHALRDDAHGRD